MKHYYYYDSEKGEFVNVNYPLRDRVFHTITSWFIIGMVLSGFIVSGLTFISGSPSEISLKKENEVLLEEFQRNVTVLSELQNKINTLANRDNEIYRTVLGLDEIPEDERLAGVGGTDMNPLYSELRQPVGDLLRQASLELETIEHQINNQDLSLKEIKAYYNYNSQKMMNLPVLRPVEGIIMSGYGMRIHPIFRVRRMHQGVDFRARVGTPVYAPGDGIIKHAANKPGGFGLTIEIDHDFGYLTRYAHLSGFAEGIRPGTKVSRGDLIGYTGRTGRVNGPHLHYEVMREGQHVDPMNYLFADLTPQEYRLFRQISEDSFRASED